MVNDKGLGRRSLDEGGFTLVEFLIAMTITAAVLGGVMTLATQMQQAYTREQDSATAEQEARFAVDWIARVIRSAGSNPYNIATSACPVANTTFQAIRVDPNANGIQDDVRIQADVNPTDGVLTGTAGACIGGQTNEDVTIAYDSTTKTITRLDRGRDSAAVAMTEPVITDLTFSYLKSDHVNTTTDPDLITYVTVSVTARSQGVGGVATSADADASNYLTTTVTEEVHLRTRG